MDNREKYKAAFSVLHMSGNMDFEPEKARMPRFSTIRKAAVACICTAVIFSLGGVAYAHGGQILREILGWGGNMKVSETTDEETGETEKTVTVMTESLTDPVQIESGKMFFVVNDEHIDITDSVSESEPFVYDYQDSDGYTHYWIVGLNGPGPGYYGYGEYIKDNDGAWVAGYTARINLDPDKESPKWLSEGKQIIGGDCPW